MEAYLIACLAASPSLSEVIAILNIIIQIYKIWKELKDEWEDEQPVVRISGLIFTKGVDF